MNDEQFALLAATVEVLGSAVRLMLVDRVKAAAPEHREQMADLVEKYLAASAAPRSPLNDHQAVAYSDFDVKRGEVVQRLMGDVRQLAGLRLKG